MSGPVEVRDFLQQHETKDTSLNFGGVPAQRTGDTSRVSDEQIRKARLAVAHIASDVEDCRQLLDMLGLVPAEDGVPPVRR